VGTPRLVDGNDIYEVAVSEELFLADLITSGTIHLSHSPWGKGDHATSPSEHHQGRDTLFDKTWGFNHDPIVSPLTLTNGTISMVCTNCYASFHVAFEYDLSFTPLSGVKFLRLSISGEVVVSVEQLTATFSGAGPYNPFFKDLAGPVPVGSWTFFIWLVPVRIDFAQCLGLRLK